MPLTDAKIRALKPEARPRRYADGAGLALEVSPGGSKLWRHRYRFAGSARMLSLGSYPAVSLAQARERLAEQRRQLNDGIDPSAHRQGAKRITRDNLENTFKAVAEEYLRTRCAALAETTKEKKARQLAIHANPWLGSRPVREITPLEVLGVLRRAEGQGKLHLTHRLRALLSQVFAYAIVTERADRNPAADLGGALKPETPQHRAAVTDPLEIGKLLRSVAGYKGSFVTLCALRLAPLTFVRPGELRKAEWSEFNLDKGEWIIPGERMKGRHTAKRPPHFVPLSTQAVAILRELHALTGMGRYVFPGARDTRRPMSENTVNAALRAMGVNSETMCGHGFRRMASTQLNELRWHPDVIERQLAHKEPNKVRDAYNGAEYLTERQQMMQAWADTLSALESGANVTPIRRRA